MFYRKRLKKIEEELDILDKNINHLYEKSNLLYKDVEDRLKSIEEDVEFNWGKKGE